MIIFCVCEWYDATVAISQRRLDFPLPQNCAKTSQQDQDLPAEYDSIMWDVTQ